MELELKWHLPLSGLVHLNFSWAVLHILSPFTVTTEAMVWQSTGWKGLGPWSTFQSKDTHQSKTSIKDSAQIKTSIVLKYYDLEYKESINAGNHHDAVVDDDDDDSPHGQSVHKVGGLLRIDLVAGPGELTSFVPLSWMRV